MAKVEVVYVPPNLGAICRQVTWHEEMTVKQVLDDSLLLKTHPEIANFAVGIFARAVSMDTIVKPDDRVEIYRPLLKDPKDRRRACAKNMSR